MAKTKKSPSIKEKEQAVKKAGKWAGAGDDAYRLACQCEKSKVYNEPMPPATPENIATTISGAMRLFLDGKIISPQIREMLAKTGLNMDFFRQSIVEETIARALQKIINSGDYEALAKLGALAGEKIDPIAAGLSGTMPVKYVSKDETDAVDSHIDSIVPPRKTKK